MCVAGEGHGACPASQGRWEALARLAVVPLALTLVASTATAQPPEAIGRPRLLLPLYVASAGLQAYDGWSTAQALAGGAQEGNPVMRGVVGSGSQLAATKAATAAFTVLAAERLWRDGHRRAAVLAMVASNAAMLVVAAQNRHVLEEVRR